MTRRTRRTRRRGGGGGGRGRSQEEATDINLTTLTWQVGKKHLCIPK